MDLALVEAARSGDEEAFASIARGSADRLFVVAHRILRDVGRAEDAVQQTLVTAWRDLPALRETERFEAWLHRILVHACYAEAKRASRWSANVVALPIDGPAAPDTTQDIVTRDALDRGFRRLPARLYLFILTHDRSDARAVFDAFVATIDLTPETAVDFPAMTKTFVSPTYGYSFKYFRGITPATEVWDPVNQQFDMSINLDDRFDANETGNEAYFEGASTELPDGVSIDDWVDEYVSPGGCGVPRSQQAKITIDGKSGRMAQCDHSEATVVAGGRLYLFIGPADDRGWFEAWIATIDLTPETAAVP
jgi:DNA-directed RNA polymerase specialized sigma24 family protein